MILTKLIYLLAASVAICPPGIPKRNPLQVPPEPAPITKPTAQEAGVPSALGGLLVAREAQDSSFGGLAAIPAALQNPNGAAPQNPFGNAVGLGGAAGGNLFVGATSSRAIGVQIGAVDGALAKHLAVDPSHSLLIAGVIDDMPAKASGVEAFDVIIAIDGRPVSGNDSLRKVLATKNVGDIVLLTIRRGCETKQIEVPVTESKANTASQTADPFGAAGGVFREYSPDQAEKLATERDQLERARAVLESGRQDLVKQLEFLAKRQVEYAAGHAGDGEANVEAHAVEYEAEQRAMDAAHGEWRLHHEQLAAAQELLAAYERSLADRTALLESEKDRLGAALAQQMQRAEDVRANISEELARERARLDEVLAKQTEYLRDKLGAEERKQLEERLAEVQESSLKALLDARKRLEVPLVELRGSDAVVEGSDAANVASWLRTSQGAWTTDDSSNAMSARLATIEETLARIEAKIDAMSAKKRGSDN